MSPANGPKPYTPENKMNILRNQKWNSVVIIISFVLLNSSIFHRLQLNTPGQQYTQSIFIYFIMTSTISIIIMSIINLILFFKHLIQKNWKELRITTAIILTSVVFLAAALAIDAPTLIYMT
ncbi:MAG: hypothetical protein OEM02_03875 [Desulfobulbaceae bacterium]|nr:hypothetical protein [Desulfobulbaceae bacterium]